MVVTDYLHVYIDFVQDRLDGLVTQYCCIYKIYGPRQFDCRDEVLSDTGVTFCYTCNYCLDRPHYVDFRTYLTAALTHQVRYSMIRQMRYYRDCKKDSAYTLHKFGKSLHGHIIDVRIKDPSEDCFRLCYDDFDFSLLNSHEKKIIDFYFWEEMTTREIAQILKIRESTVRQSKKRALNKLKKRNRHLLN